MLVDIGVIFGCNLDDVCTISIEESIEGVYCVRESLFDPFKGITLLGSTIAKVIWWNESVVPSGPMCEAMSWRWTKANGGRHVYTGCLDYNGFTELVAAFKS